MRTGLPSYQNLAYLILKVACLSCLQHVLIDNHKSIYMTAMTESIPRQRTNARNSSRLSPHPAESLRPPHAVLQSPVNPRYREPFVQRMIYLRTMVSVFQVSQQQVGRHVII